MRNFDINYTDRTTGSIRTIKTDSAAHALDVWAAAKPGAPVSLWEGQKRLAELVEWSPGFWRVT